MAPRADALRRQWQRCLLVLLASPWRWRVPTGLWLALSFQQAEGRGSVHGGGSARGRRTDGAGAAQKAPESNERAWAWAGVGAGQGQQAGAAGSGQRAAGSGQALVRWAALSLSRFRLLVVSRMTPFLIPGRVGKTSLVVRYCNDEFNEKQQSTIQAVSLQQKPCMLLC